MLCLGHESPEENAALQQTFSTVCFLDKWPQTKCRATLEINILGKIYNIGTLFGTSD